MKRRTHAVSVVLGLAALERRRKWRQRVEDQREREREGAPEGGREGEKQKRALACTTRVAAFMRS